MPALWKNLDLTELQIFTLTVRKGAQHPNAAKLVGLYLASPDGAKFLAEECGAYNQFYPGNLEHDISMDAKKDGIPEHSISSYPGLVEFLLSDQYTQLTKEIKLFFDTVK